MTQYQWLHMPFMDDEKLKKLGETMSEGVTEHGFNVHSWQHNKDGGITVLMVLPETVKGPEPIPVLGQRPRKPMADPQGGPEKKTPVVPKTPSDS